MCLGSFFCLANTWFDADNVAAGGDLYVIHWMPIAAKLMMPTGQASYWAIGDWLIGNDGTFLAGSKYSLFGGRKALGMDHDVTGLGLLSQDQGIDGQGFIIAAF